MPLLGGMSGLAGDVLTRKKKGAAGDPAVDPKAPVSKYAPTDMSGSYGRLSGELQTQLDAYNKKATELEGVENSRGAAAEKIVTDAAARADVPTITDKQIRERFATSTDSSARSFMDQAANLREYMGESGVTGGGLIAGALASIEGQRIAANIGARADLSAFKATSDALDRQKMFDRSKDVASAVNRPVSMLGMDALTNTVEARLGMLGVDAEYEAARLGAKAAKQAGKDAQTGGWIQAGAGLIRSIL